MNLTRRHQKYQKQTENSKYKNLKIHSPDTDSKLSLICKMFAFTRSVKQLNHENLQLIFTYMWPLSRIIISQCGKDSLVRLNLLLIPMLSWQSWASQEQLCVTGWGRCHHSFFRWMSKILPWHQAGIISGPSSDRKVQRNKAVMRSGKNIGWTVTKKGDDFHWTIVSAHGFRLVWLKFTLFLLHELQFVSSQ